MDSSNTITIKLKTGEELQYTLLNTLEFTSTRKRQSSIIRDPYGKLILYTKGADNVIIDRLDRGRASRNNELIEPTARFVEEYAKDGLRTLYLAKREIGIEEYEEWNKEAEKAMLVTQGREEKVAAVNEKIEKDLTIIGSTAIEDRLQDEVDETIQFAKKAGIKVWVLTGDKIGTAINIGLSAGLLDPKDQMDQYIIREDESRSRLKVELDESLKKI